MQAATAAAVAKYGVGACGPRGFYGTIDTHLTLEAALARFMGAQEAIIYSYDVATMTSVLPSFASRKDVIVLDDLCPWPARNGAMLSRATGAPLPVTVLGAQRRHAVARDCCAPVTCLTWSACSAWRRHAPRSARPGTVAECSNSMAPPHAAQRSTTQHRS